MHHHEYFHIVATTQERADLLTSGEHVVAKTHA